MFSLIFLLACPGGKDSGDTAESTPSTDDSTNTGTDCTTVAFEATGSEGVCDGNGTCTWNISGTQEMGTVTLYLIETGDPAFDPAKCGPGKGDVACGVWSEIHDAFAFVEAAGDCGEKKSLALNAVGAVGDQVDNTSTLFDTEIGTSVSWLFVATDTSGAVACSSGGHNPGAFDVASVGCQ